MFVRARMPSLASSSQTQPDNILFDSSSRFALASKPGFIAIILLLAVAVLSTLCATAAQAAGSKNTVISNQLHLWGLLPSATVHKTYNAFLTVGGGTSPYHFSVKTGALPPGISLNAATGALSGKPMAAGNYAFEVIVTDSPGLDRGNGTLTLVVGSDSSPAGAVSVSISPSSVTLTSGQQQQFTATVSGTANTAVTWSATAGTISSLGLFIAPTVSAPTSVYVKATSNYDPTQSITVPFMVNPAATAPPVQITTSTLTQAEQGNTYSESLAASGGSTPYNWSISSGAAPSGITLNASGTLTGVPTATGTQSFTATVADAKGATASNNFSVTVVAGSNFDGPAELPRLTVSSALSDTPALGSVINVNAGGDLQSALNNASCGETIQLQAGATFVGQYKLPAKNCDSGHWIILRTSSPDSGLPAEGQRATPCYAGVASLPGRPQYSCASAKNVMAKLDMQAQGDGPIELMTGATYYRLIGLEITRTATKSARLISGAGNISHIVVDRSWLHGTAQGETRNGMDLDGMTSIAIVDSYLNDFHCVANTGSCTDAHAISGGNGKSQDGPYKIQDNFLEASGEAIMFGGGPATMSPADIQILNNHFWKPWQWMPGNPNFVGAPNGNPFVVKNHLELKNAVRVLIEANLMENSWGGFSQTGFGILLTPLNQATDAGLGPFVCPLCQVTDVTIRYTHISHAGGGIQMAAVEDTPHGPGQPALAGERWSIHDIVIDDLSKKYSGNGTGFTMGSTWSKNALNNITINHVTVFPDPRSHMITMGSKPGRAQMYGLVFTNNLVLTGRYPIWDGMGGTGSCSHDDIPKTSISKCFATYVFSNNALIGAPAAFPPSLWPANNMFPSSVNAVSFMTFSNGDGGNYELQSGSPYKNKGTDGKDLGADIVGLNAALANVE